MSELEFNLNLDHHQGEPELQMNEVQVQGGRSFWTFETCADVDRTVKEDVDISRRKNKLYIVDDYNTNTVTRMQLQNIRINIHEPLPASLSQLLKIIVRADECRIQVVSLVVSDGSENPSQFDLAVCVRP